MQFANNQIELFDRLETQTNQLYHQLCQDYQKWNNLRVFKVIKESDLSILGQCTSDCRLLEHQLQTMDFLLQDLSFTRDQKIVDFFCKNYHQYLVKNYICNIIESMANRLFDHFTVVNLDFETGVPELIKGNKNTLMYLLYTFLYSTTFDLKRPKLKIEEKELRISVCILRVNMEKSGYDLEFSIYYPCTPKLIQIYATFFSQGEYEPQNDKEQLLLYMMLKCKQLSQQNNQEIQFVTDGDSLTVRFSVSVTLISQQQTQCNETISNPSNVNTMNDNILFVDLTFTKTISQTNHFQWKAKSQNPTNTVLPLKFDKALSETNSEKKEESQKQQQQQQQQQSQSQDDPQIEQLLYPEFKDDVLLLLEDIIRQAYQEGLIDKESIGITQNTEGKVGAYSEIADSEILDSPTQFSPKLFKTPQMKPRRLQSLRKDMIKKQLENVKQKKPNSSKNRQPTKTKQLSVLFSPSVMSKFANNLTKISTQKYKNHLFQGSLNSLNEIDDSKNQSLSHYQMFGSQVFKSRMLAHKRYWSHHVQITDMPKIFPQILCYVPNTKLIEIAKRFGNTTYGQQVVIREPLIVFEIHDAIKEYKKILEQGFQFYFILLYIQKQNEVIDFTNTIKANEKEIIKKFPSFKPTNIIGVSDKAQQLNLQFCANLNYIMSVNLNESQLKSSKGYIASLIDGNK